MNFKVLTLLLAVVGFGITFIITGNPVNSIGVGTIVLVIVTIALAVLGKIADRYGDSSEATVEDKAEAKE